MKCIRRVYDVAQEERKRARERNRNVEKDIEEGNKISRGRPKKS